MTATLTPDALRERITEAEAVIADVQVKLGDAALHGKPATALVEQQAEARAAIEACRAALTELERRETDAAYREQLAAASTRRRGEYLYAAELSQHADAMLEAKRVALAAENAFLALRRDPRAQRFTAIASGHRFLDAQAIDLDADVVESVCGILGPANTRGAADIPAGQLLDQSEQLRTLAEQRAAEEESGEGTDFAGAESARVRGRRELRARRRAEAREHQQRELAERVARAERQAAARQGRRVDADNSLFGGVGLGGGE